MRIKPRLLLLLIATVGIVICASTGAVGAKTRAATSSPIQHIVVLYLENQSFDSLLGFWCDGNPGRCPDGGMPSQVVLSDNSQVTPGVMGDVVPSVSHNISAQVKAINGGAMNGWENVAGCSATDNYACIAGYTPAQVPNLATLADNFAISDHTFSMADSPSWEGHLYAVMPSTDGFQANIPQAAKGITPGPGWGCNSNKVARWVSSTREAQWVPSCIPDYSLGPVQYPYGGAFEKTPVSYAPTIMDELQAAGLSWKIYGEPQPENSQGMTNPGYIWDVCPSYAECWDTAQRANNVASAHFINDAQAGNLPSFSLVLPAGHDTKYSEHNGYSMTLGDDWIGQIASAIMNGPEWDSTVLFVTWDDCGCFYDEVPPGTNPDGTVQGPRVPLLIVSPYARPAYTNTTATTFASILGYVEQTFGLAPLGVNDAQAYAFANAFNYNQAPLRPVKMVERPMPKGDHIDWAQGREGT